MKGCRRPKNANGPESPGAAQNSSTALCLVTSIGNSPRYVKVTEELSLRFSSANVSSRCLLTGEMGPAAFEPAPATWTECRASHYTMGPMIILSGQRDVRKDRAHKSSNEVPEWEPPLRPARTGQASTVFRTASSNVSHAVRSTSRGARSRIFIK